MPDKQGQPLWPRSHWNFSSWPTLSLLTLPYPFLPVKTTVEDLAQCSPIPFPPDWPWWSWVAQQALPLWNYKKLHFQWQLFPNQLASQYLIFSINMLNFETAKVVAYLIQHLQGKALDKGNHSVRELHLYKLGLDFKRDYTGQIRPSSNGHLPPTSHSIQLSIFYPLNTFSPIPS